MYEYMYITCIYVALGISESGVSLKKLLKEIELDFEGLI